MTVLRKLIIWSAAFGLLLLLGVLGLNGLISYRNTTALYDNAEWVDHTHQVLHELASIQADLADAETGQRGFLLTGDETFLLPSQEVHKRLEDRLEKLGRLIEDNPKQQSQVNRLRDQVTSRLDLLDKNTSLPRTKATEAARLAALSEGRTVMENVRKSIAEIQDVERNLLARRSGETERSYRKANITTGVATCIAAAVMVAAYVLLRRNLASRQLQEDQAKESAWFTRLLLDSSAEGIYGIDADGVVTFINTAGAKMLGYESPDELVGKNMHATVHHTRPDGSPYPLEECPTYLASQQGKRGARIDSEWFWRKNGSSFPVEYVSSPLRRDGEAAGGAVVSFSNITVRKRQESEKAEQAAFDAMRADVGAALVQSSSLSEVLQQCASALAGRIDSAFVRIWTLGDDEGQLELQAKAGAMEGGIDTGHFIKTGEGEIGRIASTAKPLIRIEDGSNASTDQAVGETHFIAGYPLIIDGKVLGVLAVASKRAMPRYSAGRLDLIADAIAQFVYRKHAEEDLKHAIQAAETANHAKSTFLANMSHELRTPLNAVILYSELLQEEAQDQGLDSFLPDLEKIRSAGRHLLGLINNILDLSKIEAGKMELFLETFDLKETAQDVAATVRPLFEKRSNRLRLDIQEDAGVLHADQTKVRQILFNLLSNASKFTQGGLVTLSISRTHGVGREGVEFSVVDTGIGMTEEQLAKLFQPFVQADVSTTRKYGGTGLGLTIVKRFCELMHGRIDVSSEAGKGTRFVVWLPAEVSSEADDETSTSSLPESAGGLAKVLVVDDDPTAQDLLSRMLTKEGYQVATAGNGKAALERAATVRPDVIVLDVMMPRMDGWAVLTALKADSSLAPIPVVMHTMVDDRNLGYALGAADYLTKPVDREQLLAVLNKYRSRAAGSVLVVEDDSEVRDAVVRTLNHAGWATSEAANGKIALERMATEIPKAVILDLMMPEMDGFGFVEQMRQRADWADVPVIVLTAKELTTEDRTRLAGNVERIVQKGSMSREALLQEVRRLVGVHTQRPVAEKV